MIHLHTVKFFQVFLFNTNNSIPAQLKAYKYRYSTLIIQFNVIHSLALRWFQVLLCNTKILFKISYLFAYS